MPSFAERFTKKISLTYWHADEYPISGDTANLSPEGDGFALAANWFFNDWFRPFLTYGKNDGALSASGAPGFNTFYEESLSIGNGIQFKSHDVLGFGVNWSKAAFDPRLPTQTVAEIYYRMMITEHLAISPNFQYVWEPAQNQDLDSVYYFQLRFRLTF